MKIYLSGPMTGIEDFNYPLFNKVATYYREQGYEVFNPAEQFEGDQTKQWFEYLQHDIKEIVNGDYDAIALLPGWEKSTGAAIEYITAVVFGLDIWKLQNNGHVEAQTKASKSLLNKALKVSTIKQNESALEEAQRLVHGDRGEAYGHPFEDFSKSALIWTAILGKEITPEQVALCMVGVKISREVNKPKRDNRVDGAGYFETLEMVHQYRKDNQ